LLGLVVTKKTELALGMSKSASVTVTLPHEEEA
jgi:hypothetical protein